MEHLKIFILSATCFFFSGSHTVYTRDSTKEYIRGSSHTVYNRRNVKRMLNDFSKEYTGLDTLIRIDGYYYHEDTLIRVHWDTYYANSMGFYSPFMLSDNGEFLILSIQYENHNQIQKKFSNDEPVGRGKGYYTLSGDTIKARWALGFQFNSYWIYSEQYLIINDTTLKRIWFSQETILRRGWYLPGHEPTVEKSDPIRDDTCKFYKYSVEKKLY